VDYCELKRSIQRALIGKVTPNLRGVYVEIKNDLFILIFFYDSPPSEVEVELASLADTEFIADFPYPEYKTDCKVITLPSPGPLPKDDLNIYCLYRRYELFPFGPPTESGIHY